MFGGRLKPVSDWFPLRPGVMKPDATDFERRQAAKNDMSAMKDTPPPGSGSPDTRPWPSELRLSKDGRTLAVAFDNGERYDFSAEYLRVKSPSAEVQGHSPDERKTVPGKQQVAIIAIQPIGNYAVRLDFDDLHTTGIYTWDYFAELGRNHAAYWQAYLDELAAKGLSRAPQRR